MKPLLFGKYCLLERVSVGGMAEVFRAKPFDEPEFRGYLALKRILPHLAEDNEFIKMFIDEAKLTVQLQHQNIVRIYELGQFQKSYYILMEFISGKDLLALQKKMRRSRSILPVNMAMFIASEICRGLHFAHHKRDADGNPLNIIHRDVSPQNVLIDYRGRVKVIDFGIAKAAVQSTRTQVGVLKGKMGYMSPEQVRGEVIDYRSDVFAIGTVLWEMLTNRRLFHAEHEYQTIGLVRDAIVDPPSTRNDVVPPEVDQIVMAALTADPEDRYDTAAAFADAIDAWLAANPFGVDDLSVWMRTVFADDLDAERAKRDEFAAIVTPEDVLRLQNEGDAAPPNAGQQPAPQPVTTEEPASDTLEQDAPIEPEPAQAEEDDGWADGGTPDDAPEVEVDAGWAGEAPDQGESIAAFADAHTRLAAGGFDASEASHAQVDLDAPLPLSEVPLSEVPLSEVPEQGEGIAERTEPDATEYGTPSLPSYAAIAPAHQATASDFKSEHTNPGPEGAQASEGLPTSIKVFAVLCLLLLVGGVVIGGIALTLAPDEQTEPIATGVIAGSIVPADGVQVHIDGALVAQESPFSVENIAVGEHAVRVTRDGYEPAERVVSVAPGATATVDIELTALPEGPGLVAVLVPEADDVQLFVNGVARELNGNEATVELDAGRYLLEAVRPGHVPWFKVTTVESNSRVEELAQLTPFTLPLEIVAGKSSVSVDNERLGRGTVVAENLNPSQLHRVSVTYRGQGVSTWSSYVGLPELLAGTIEVDFDKPTPRSWRKGDYGYLQVATGKDWWNVKLNGTALGLRTPIEADAKLPITPGTHQLTLERAGVEKTFEVEIAKGETFIWRQDIAFDWKQAL